MTRLPPVSRDAGMTLIELVVAMAVFALVAVMGLQALSGTLRHQTRTASLDANHVALATGTAVLRQDLKAILPMLFFAPGDPNPKSALQTLPNDTGLALSRAYVPRLDTPRVPDLAGRVIWAIDPDTKDLTRSTWPTLTPVRPTQQRTAVPILSNVNRIETRSFWPGTGWVPGVAPPFAGTSPPSAPPGAPAGDTDSALGAAAPEVYSDLLPVAIEVTLFTRTHGPITLLESLQ